MNADEIARGLAGLTYYSLLLPWCPVRRNPWTPRDEDRGTPFEVRSVGSFTSYAEAVEWAATHLNGSPYSVARYTVNEAGEPIATPAHLVRD